MAVQWLALYASHSGMQVRSQGTMISYSTVRNKTKFKEKKTLHGRSDIKKCATVQ